MHFFIGICRNPVYRSLKSIRRSSKSREKTVPEKKLILMYKMHLILEQRKGEKLRKKEEKKEKKRYILFIFLIHKHYENEIMIVGV